MGALFWLSDEQWEAVEPRLPKNQPGAPRVDESDSRSSTMKPKSGMSR
jgi:transposase